jgi:hypothetical protein
LGTRNSGKTGQVTELANLMETHPGNTYTTHKAGQVTELANLTETSLLNTASKSGQANELASHRKDDPNDDYANLAMVGEHPPEALPEDDEEDTPALIEEIATL